MQQSISTSFWKTMRMSSQIFLALFHCLSLTSSCTHLSQISKLPLVFTSSSYMRRAACTLSRSSRSHQQKQRLSQNFMKNSLLFLRMFSTLVYLFVSFSMQWKTSSHNSTSSVCAIKLLSQTQEMFQTYPFSRSNTISSRQIGLSASMAGLPSKQRRVIWPSSLSRLWRQPRVLRQMSVMRSLRWVFCSSGVSLSAEALNSLMARAVSCSSWRDSNQVRKLVCMCSSPVRALVNNFLQNQYLVASLIISQYSQQSGRARESAPTSMMAFSSSFLYFCLSCSQNIDLQVRRQAVHSSQLFGFRLRAMWYSSNLVSCMYSVQQWQLKGKYSRKMPSTCRQLSDCPSTLRYSAHRRYFSAQSSFSISFRNMLSYSFISSDQYQQWQKDMYPDL